MGRHVGPSCKLCRRENEKLFLKSEKCQTAKCPFGRRAYAPGQHGKGGQMRLSEYGIRLREKQKARRIYSLTEMQFASYFAEAARRKGATGEKLLEYLERRLDNVVFRLGFVGSRRAARQMVRHGGVWVNNRKANIPAFRVKSGDVIMVRPVMAAQVKAYREKNIERIVPSWLTVSGEVEGKVLSLPVREEIDTILQEHLIVEYYSR